MKPKASRWLAVGESRPRLGFVNKFKFLQDLTSLPKLLWKLPAKVARLITQPEEHKPKHEFILGYKDSPTINCFLNNSQSQIIWNNHFLSVAAQPPYPFSPPPRLRLGSVRVGRGRSGWACKGRKISFWKLKLNCSPTFLPFQVSNLSV